MIKPSLLVDEEIHRINPDAEFSNIEMEPPTIGNSELFLVIVALITTREYWNFSRNKSIS